MGTATIERTDFEKFFQESSKLLEQIERQNAEIKKWGDAYQETKNALDAANKRVDELELKLQRPRTSAGSPDDAPSIVRKAFLKVIANNGMLNGVDGQPVITREEMHAWTEALNKAYRGKDGGLEQKAISLFDNTAGGYLLMPPEYVADIIKKVVLVSPVAQFANVIQTTHNTVWRPKRTATLTAQWVSEIGTRSESGTGSTLAYSMVEQTTYELFATVLISLQQMEDAAFNMDQVVQDDVAEQFAKAEGTAFVKGTGNGQPEGITVNANVLANYVPGTDASTVVYAGLNNLVHKLPSPYAPNARFGFNRKTLGLIRGISDSNGRPLWLPNFGAFDAGNPATILGSPYSEFPDMPDVAPNAFPIIFGDFKQGYTIVRRLQMSVQRLVEKYADTGQIGIQVRERVGGQVTNDEAFVLMKIATS